MNMRREDGQFVKSWYEPAQDKKFPGGKIEIRTHEELINFSKGNVPQYDHWVAWMLNDGDAKWRIIAAGEAAKEIEIGRR